MTGLLPPLFSCSTTVHVRVRQSFDYSAAEELPFSPELRYRYLYRGLRRTVDDTRKRTSTRRLVLSLSCQFKALQAARSTTKSRLGCYIWSRAPHGRRAWVFQMTRIIQGKTSIRVHASHNYIKEVPLYPMPIVIRIAFHHTKLSCLRILTSTSDLTGPIAATSPFSFEKGCTR